MLISAWIRLSSLLAATALFAAATATPALGSEPRAYGQRLLAQYRLPPETIARYAATAAGSARPAVPREHSVFADRAPWVGPEQRVGVGHNPYTLVLTVHGVARSAGAAFAQWQAGWELREAPSASRELSMAVPRVAGTGLAAGQALSMTVGSARVSFRGERSVAPMLGLVQAHNLDIRDVELQVWSGEAPPAWAAMPGLRPMLLALALVCLLAALGFRTQRRPVAAAAVPAPMSAPAYARALAVQSTEPPPAAPTDAVSRNPPAAPDLAAEVLEALTQVLTVGPKVATVWDETRPPRRHAAPG